MTIILLLGNSKPEFIIAERTRSRASLTSVSGKPTKAKAGRTIGVDPEIIPYGSKVKIGRKTYIAEDTGGAIKGKKQIDVFCRSHFEALCKGVKYKKVYLIQKKKVRIKCKK